MKIIESTLIFSIALKLSQFFYIDRSGELVVFEPAEMQSFLEQNDQPLIVETLGMSCINSERKSIAEQHNRSHIAHNETQNESYIDEPLSTFRSNDQMQNISQQKVSGHQSHIIHIEVQSVAELSNQSHIAHNEAQSVADISNESHIVEPLNTSCSNSEMQNFIEQNESENEPILRELNDENFRNVLQ